MPGLDRVAQYLSADKQRARGVTISGPLASVNRGVRQRLEFALVAKDVLDGALDDERRRSPRYEQPLPFRKRLLVQKRRKGFQPDKLLHGPSLHDRRRRSPLALFRVVVLAAAHLPENDLHGNSFTTTS